MNLVQYNIYEYLREMDLIDSVLCTLNKPDTDRFGNEDKIGNIVTIGRSLARNPISNGQYILIVSTENQEAGSQEFTFRTDGIVTNGKNKGNVLHILSHLETSKYKDRVRVNCGLKGSSVIKPYFCLTDLPDEESDGVYVLHVFKNTPNMSSRILMKIINSIKVY